MKINLLAIIFLMLWANFAVFGQLDAGKQFSILENNFPGDQQEIIKNIGKDFEPNADGGNMYPPLWNLPIQTDKICGIIVALEANPRINDIPIGQNDYIGGFFTDLDGQLKCGGAIYWPDTAGIVFVLFGDNYTTPDIKEGFSQAEHITFKLFSFSTMKEYLVDEIAFDVSPSHSGTDKWYPLGLSRVVNMKANEDIDFFILPSDNPICIGNSVTLQGQELIGTTGNYTFQWSSDPPGFNYTTQYPPATIPNTTTTYFLTVNDGALQSEAELTVHVSGLPSVEAGSDGEICANQTFQLSGTAQNYVSVLWTTSGDGTINNPQSLVTTYTPGVNDKISGQLDFTLTVQPLNPCDDAVVDQLQLIVNPLPTVSAGQDKTACTNENIEVQAAATAYGSVQWTTSGSGTFISPNSLVTQYVAAGNDVSNGVTLTVTVGGDGNCYASSASDQVHVAYVPGPTVNAPNSKTKCENQTVAINGVAYNASSTEWTTAGDGTFDNPLVLSTVYNPGTNDKNNGGVIVTLNAYPIGNCASASKNVTINLIKLPEVVSFGENTEKICNGDVYMQLDATVNNANTISWSTNGDGTFSSTSILNPKYYPGNQDLQNNEFELVLSATPLPYCVVGDSKTQLVTVQDLPTANVGQQATICENQVHSLSTAVATGFSQLLWTTSGDGVFNNTTIEKPVYTPGILDIQNGVVQLTLTAFALSPCAVNATASKFLYIRKEVVANAGSDASICQTGTYTLNGTAANFSTYSWATNGDGSFSNTNIVNPVYTPGAGDISSGLVTLTLTAQPNAPCLSVASDFMLLHIQHAAAASAGSDATICDNQNHNLNTASAANYLSLNWTTSGNGTFSNSHAVNPTYYPNAADIASGTVTLTISATAISPCQINITDSKILAIVKSALVNAGSDAGICETETYTLNGSAANFSAFSWASSGDGTFSNPNIVNPVYTPGTGDISSGLVTITLTAQPNSPCTTVAEDFMLLQIQQNVTAMAGADISICDKENFTLGTASASNYDALQWTTSGDGIFSDPTTVNPVYTPGIVDVQNGTVELTISAAAISPCLLDATDAMTLSVSIGATANAGSDDAICVTETYTLNGTVAYYSSYQWVTSGDGSFNNPNIENPEYTPGVTDISNGQVTLTLEAQPNAPCLAVAEDFMLLQIQQNVTAMAGADISICDTENFTLSAASASNYDALQWTTSGDGIFNDPTTVNPVYTPGSADVENGTVELTISAAAISPCLLDATDAMTLSVSIGATANAGSDAAICETDTYTLNGTVAYYSSYQWVTSGDGSFNNPNIENPEYTPGVTDISNGQVTLTLEAQPNAPCLAVAEDFMMLQIQQNVTAMAGADISICDTENFTLSAASASNYNALQWTTSGDGIFSDPTTVNPVYTPGIVDFQNGTVELTISAEAVSPCLLNATDAMTLSVSIGATANAGSDAAICETDAYTLTGTVEYYSSFEWVTNGDGSFNNPNIENPEYTPGVTDISNGQVTLSLIALSNAPCDATATDNMILQISKEAIVSAGTTKTVCGSAPIFLSDVSALNYTSVLWATSGDGTFNNSGILKPVYFPGQDDLHNPSIILTITLGSVSPCTGTVSATKTIGYAQPPTAQAGDNVIACGEQVELTATASDFAAISWTTSGNGTFENGNTLTPTYYPGSIDLFDQQAELTILAGPNSPCQIAAVDHLTYYIDIPNVEIDDVEDVEVEAGSFMVLTFWASSALPGQYCWFHDGVLMPGQDNISLVLFDVSPSDAGEYQAKYQSTCDELISNIALVEVMLPSIQEINIPAGWSGFSSYITPENPSLETVFSGIEDNMVIMSNFQGYYWPGLNTNTLGDISLTDGYQIKLLNSAALSVSGMIRYPITKLALDPGWSYLPVIATCPVDVDLQFSGEPDITMVKDVAGTGIYWPELNINTLGNLVPGSAYYILSTSVSPLAIKFLDCNGEKSGYDNSTSTSVDSPWNSVNQTAVNHIFGFSHYALSAFDEGDIIGAFNSDGICAGLLRIDASNPAEVLVAFGNDPLTGQIDGFTQGDVVSFRLYKKDSKKEYDLEVVYDGNAAQEGVFTGNGISIIREASIKLTTSVAEHHFDETSMQVYPNPTSGELNISIQNLTSETGKLMLTNLNGQVVMQKEFTSSEGLLNLNLSNLPKGVYYLQVVAGSFMKVEKIVLK